MTYALALIIGLAGQCTGADPAIVSVTPAQSTNADDLDRYTLTIGVKNVGSKAQKASDLQSVDIFLDGTKNGEKGIPPLEAGQTYSFTYDVLRADGARPGSTSVGLSLKMHAPAGDATQNCSSANDRTKVSI